MKMEVESNLVALHHGSRIPEMLGTFHLDDHNVQEWSDVSQPGLQHRARQEVGKWIDSDKNADIQFQKREDSKQSERGREQQIGFVVIGNAPDAKFQIVQSQRKLNDESGARVSTMSTSYQMSSTRGVHSTTKTTSNKTTTKTVTVSGGRTDDFDTIKMSFQPLDTSTQRERLNVTRAGTMGVRRPPTRRHTPAAVLPTTPDDDDDMMGVNDDDDLESPSVRITEIHSSTNSSSKMLDSSPSSASPVSVGFKNLSPKIRVGFPVEIQLELQSKLRYSNGGSGGEQMMHHIETELNDDEQTEIESSSRLLSATTSSSNMTKTSTTLSSSSSSLTPAVTTSTITDTNNFRSSNSSSSKMQQQQESSTKIIEAERSHESIDANESANSLFHPLNNSANNNADLTFDFSERRKSYGFEPFDTEQPETTPTISEVETNTTITSPRNILNNNISNNNSNIYSKPTIPVKSPYERPTNNNNNFNLTPSSLSRSWDLIQSVTNAQQRREANKKLFSSSSTLDDLGNSVGSKSLLASNGYNSNNKAPQKTIITLNAFEENDGDSDAPPEFSTTHNNKRRLSHEFTLDSLEAFPNHNNNNNKNNSYLSSRMNNSRRSVSSDNIEKSQIIGSPPDIIHHNIKQHQPSSQRSDVNKSSSASALSFEKSRNIIKMLDETPDLLNKMSFKHYYPPSNVETIEIQPPPTKPTWNHHHNNSDSNGTQLDYLNDSLSRILNEGKDLNHKTNNNHSQNSSSKYSFGKNERTTTVNNNNSNNMHNNNHSDEEFEEDVVVNKTGKQTQISHTWISSIDQKKPSQHARDTDVTTSISATNDPFKRAQKKVEFCKTEVHFTPDSGKFHIVETDENKPSTVHLFRRKKRGDKKSTSSISAPSSSSTSTSPTSTNSTETKKLVEKFSEKRDKINHEQTSDERKLHHDTSTITSSIRTIGAELNNNSSSEGLERVKKSAVVDMMVGVDDDDDNNDEDKKKRNSLFHRWTEQDAKPEDEVTGTPTTTSTNNISSSSSLNHGNRELDQIELNFDDDDNILATTTTASAAKVSSLQLRRDKNKLIPDHFDLPTIHHAKKTTTHTSNRSDKGSLQHVVRNYRSNTTLINELLNDLGDEGDDGDESRTDMILSNYGDELKIQRYLKQLKSPSSHAGSESPTDFLQMNDDYDDRGGSGGRDPDQTNFDQEGDDDDDDSSKNFHFDNVLYENGSFVPRATRRSLIEMNNRNRKRIGAGSHSHTSDNSSTTSNYSLPHSDRDSNYQPLKLATMEATVDTLGKPQITSVELRYALDKDKNSYFSEPVKRNFRIPPKSSDKIDKEEEHIYDLPTPVKPVGLRSLPPPYNKNARSSVTGSPVGGGLSTPLRPTNSCHHSKPPLPILPSLFSSFEKTGVALRKRSELKNHQSTSINSENKFEESNDSMATMTENVKSEPNYVPSTSIVTIGGDGDGEGVSNKKKSEGSVMSDYYNNVPISPETSEQQPVETDEVGIDGITISPELLLNNDGMWQGPAHQNSFNEHQHNNKVPSVMRSMTFPKSRTEPEWVTKARSREARKLDWSLIGSKQHGNNTSTTTRSSEPPWISEIRFKSKVVTPSPEIQSLPKISIVYPWQRRSTTMTEDSSEPTEKEPDNINKMTFQEKDETNNRKYCTATTDHRKVEQPVVTNGGVEIVELLPDEDNKDDRIVTGKPPPHSIKKMKTEYSATTGHDYHHSNRDSDSILINPIQIPARDSSLKKEKKSSPLNRNNKNNNNNSTDYSPSAIDKKLFAPLLESTKQSRKPLQSSQHSNKNSNINNNNAATTTTTNNKLIPSEKQLKKPPRPPKPTPPPPPLRSSSLNCKSGMTDKTNNNNNNKRTLRASPEESMVTSSSRSTPVQVHRHPLVKVAKLPTTKTSVIISSSPDSSKLKKAKYHVSLINEKNQTDSHRHHPGSLQQSSSNPTLTATTASPHRKR